jgi:uncharacterized membrane protein
MSHAAGKRTRSIQEKVILGFKCTEHKLNTLKRHFACLAAASVFTKLAVILITTNILHSFIDTFDISIYLQYALQIHGGQIPYVDFPIEYPQLSIVVFIVPLLFALLTQDPYTYLFVHQGFMSIFDLLTTFLVYLVAMKVSDQKTAFLSGMLSATAFSSAYFVLTKYDAFPTFLLMLSVFLFIYGKDTIGYFAATAGFLAKWFPFLAVPYFLLHELIAGRDIKTILWHLAPSIGLASLIATPFLLMDPQGFLGTYLAHTGREALAHSFCYYIDFVLVNTLNAAFFTQISLFLMVLLQVFLFWYYYALKNTSEHYLCAFLFFGIFTFVVMNKVFSPQFILWLTPLMAILLMNNYKEILLFYLIQIWMYLEFPILYRAIYINDTYFIADGNPFVSAPFLFFSVKFILLFIAFVVVWSSIRHPDIRILLASSTEKKAT